MLTRLSVIYSHVRKYEKRWSESRKYSRHRVSTSMGDDRLYKCRLCSLQESRLQWILMKLSETETLFDVMNEETPLTSNGHGQGNNHNAIPNEIHTTTADQYYEDLEEEEEWSKTTLYSIYATGAIFTIGCLYFFAFYLPSLFIPEARIIDGIIKVADIESVLTPISSERVIELGMIASSHIEETLFDAVDEYTHEEEYNTIDLDGKTKKKRKVERFILIGDVHGHYDELRTLLKSMKYTSTNDHLLLLGDFISKGPDSIKVIDYLIENNIDCIMGNHEYYALQNYAQFHGLDYPAFVNNRTDDSIKSNPMKSKSMKSKSISKNGFNNDPEFLLAKKLHPQHLEYINNCPVIKTLGKVPLSKPNKKSPLSVSYGSKTSEGIAVHAGVRWDLSKNLQDQIPSECLEMRSLTGPFLNESTDDPHLPNAISWSKVWNTKQKIIPRNETKVVYYGHDARRGLNLKKFAIGLDTGCDRGDNLSGIIIWKEAIQTKSGKIKYLYKQQPHQVSCK